MTIFIKLKDQNYKLPNKIIVGRGEPFGVFNDDRAVARTHLILKHVKGRNFVKDLGSDGGTLINGNFLKPHIFVELSFEDVLTIGKCSMQILGTEPVGEVIEIKRSNLSLTRNFFQAHGLNTFFSLIALWCLITDIQDGETWFNALATLLVVFFFWFMVKSWMWIIQKLRPPILMTDAFISEDGFTVHYSDGKNMTFKKDHIQSWFTWASGKYISLKAYDQEYVLHTQGQFKALFNYLEKHHSHQLAKTRPQGPKLMIGGFSLLCIGNTVNGLTQIYLGLLVGLPMFLGSLLMLLAPKYKEFWPVPVSKIYSQRKQTLSILAICLFSLFQFVSSWDSHKTYTLLEKCHTGNKPSCSKIDFLNINPRMNEVSSLTIVSACEGGNETACQRIQMRGIASEKPSP